MSLTRRAGFRVQIAGAVGAALFASERARKKACQHCHVTESEEPAECVALAGGSGTGGEG